MPTPSMSDKQVAKLMVNFFDKYRKDANFEEFTTKRVVAFVLADLIDRDIVTLNSDMVSQMELLATWDYMCENFYRCDPDGKYDSLDDMTVIKGFDFSVESTEGSEKECGCLTSCSCGECDCPDCDDDCDCENNNCGSCEDCSC